MSAVIKSAQSPVLYQYRCKICQLSSSHPDFFKELHQLVLEANLSLTRAMNVMNDKIDRQALDIVKLNNQNMSVHFSNHISLTERMVNETSKTINPGNPALRDINPEVGLFVEDMLRRKLGNDVNDYLNLDRVRSMLTEKLEILDGMIARTGLDEADTQIDFEAMPHYIALVREIRKSVTDINKMRQSKQLISMVIKSLVEKNTIDIVRQMAREHDQVMKDLLVAGVPEQVVNDAKLKLGMRLAEVVAVTARNAISDVMRSYKLD